MGYGHTRTSYSKYSKHRPTYPKIESLIAMVINSRMSTMRRPHILLPKEETPSGTRDPEVLPAWALDDLDLGVVLLLLPVLLSLCSLFSSIAHPPLPPKGEYELLGTEDPAPF